jgi:DNA-directed RNA polymerase sigma subunit (sigma70/sigma32)
MDAVLSKFRQEIARGVARNEAIADARKAGATLKAIGEALGVTRQRVRQILNRQRLRELLGMRESL